MLPTVVDVYQARRRIGGRILHTPLRPSSWLSSVTGGDAHLKIESANLTGSFKIRGAMNAALRLADGTNSEIRTIVTASAGNHGRALAMAAEQLGLSCVVFAPATAPDAKKNAIRRMLDVAVVPLGGGGLASGLGLALKAVAPQVRVVGVEVEASTPFTASLEAGRITEIAPRTSLADGLVGNLEPGSMTFSIVKQVVDGVVTVSEDDLARAMTGLAFEERLIVEGAGAASVAAIMTGKASTPGQRVVAIVTGGNVDLPKWLLTIS